MWASVVIEVAPHVKLLTLISNTTGVYLFIYRIITVHFLTFFSYRLFFEKFIFLYPFN